MTFFLFQFDNRLALKMQLLFFRC